MRATLTDAVGRRVSAATPALTVDTTRPELSVQVDRIRADRGVIALDATTEPGSRVVVNAGDAGRRESAPADGRWSVTLPADSGKYDIVVTSTDRFGNQTRRPLTVAVTKPMTKTEVFIGLIALMILVGVPVFLGWLLWRRRRQVREWLARRRELARQCAAAAARARAVEAYQQALATHAAERHRWQQTHEAWAARRRWLMALVTLAEEEKGGRPHGFAEIKLRADERVYTTVPAGLVELRKTDGQFRRQVVQSGTATVTTARIVFDGEKRREWAYDKLVDVAYPTPAQTMLVVSNRQNPSGLDYSGPEAERTRVLIDLAIADRDGRRNDVVASLRRELTAHSAVEPTEPTPPRPPADSHAAGPHSERVPSRTH